MLNLSNSYAAVWGVSDGFQHLIHLKPLLKGRKVYSSLVQSVSALYTTNAGAGSWRLRSPWGITLLASHQSNCSPLRRGTDKIEQFEAPHCFITRLTEQGCNSVSDSAVWGRQKCLSIVTSNLQFQTIGQTKVSRSRAERREKENYISHWPRRAHHSLHSTRLYRSSRKEKVLKVASREGEPSDTVCKNCRRSSESLIWGVEAFWFPRVRKWDRKEKVTEKNQYADTAYWFCD